ncbi:MAG: alpha/beta hydrolase-fold protein [Gemmatimonadales bacterium]
MHRITRPYVVFPLATLALLGPTNREAPADLEFAISFDTTIESQPLDGRVLLILTTSDESEPRFQVNAGLDAAQIFGIDVEGLRPGTDAVIGGGVFGFPLESLARVPAGDYYVQAVLHKYETFHLSNGKSVKLPMDRGEGQHWNRAPGNLYSTPRRVHVDPSATQRIAISLDNVIPPIAEPKDTKYIRHIRFKSELLSEFWGRPMYLGAHVLVPEGFDTHPESRFPLIVFQGHFPSDFGGFRTEPPDPNLKPDYSARFDVHGYNRIQQQEAYDFYKKWISPNFPRMLIVEIQHPTPYYDDSYAVNSASMGPWGDALTYELIPYIEKQFRGIGEGWARFLYGGSTGGWEALAVQVFYPDEYNGTFAACPDPIDFRAYTQVNIYDDDNAYYLQGQFKKVERPGHRNWLGEIEVTMRDYNYYELALGSHGRSGEQWDIWQAVYSPMGHDGYPKPIWDKRTGKIDHEVAEYWRENYDLRYIMERDWATLGPKLKGKIHIYAGDMDNYYLNNAVYLTEKFLESTTDPYYEGEVDYGDRAEHCWNGDHANPNHISRLRYNTRFVPKILERIKQSAPFGADLTTWRY